MQYIEGFRCLNLAAQRGSNRSLKILRGFCTNIFIHRRANQPPHRQTLGWIGPHDQDQDQDYDQYVIKNVFAQRFFLLLLFSVMIFINCANIFLFLSFHAKIFCTFSFPQAAIYSHQSRPEARPSLPPQPTSLLFKKLI